MRLREASDLAKVTQLSGGAGIQTPGSPLLSHMDGFYRDHSWYQGSPSIYYYFCPDLPQPATTLSLAELPPESPGIGHVAGGDSSGAAGEHAGCPG